MKESYEKLKEKKNSFCVLYKTVPYKKQNHF